MTEYRPAQRDDGTWTVEGYVRHWVFWRRWADVYAFRYSPYRSFHLSFATARDAAQDANRLSGQPDSNVVLLPRRAG